MRSRARRASIGAEPPDEIATISGERSTIAGTWKDDSSASSTTLTKMCLAFAAAATFALTTASSVAAIASQRPSSCSAENCRARWRMRPERARSASAGVSVGAATSTFALAATSSAALRSATAPPPTSRTARPERSANKGNRFIASRCRNLRRFCHDSAIPPRQNAAAAWQPMTRRETQTRHARTGDFRCGRVVGSAVLAGVARLGERLFGRLEACRRAAPRTQT